MASRAHLLAGLRTGGPRASSPFEGSEHFDNNNEAHREATRAMLKANAAPFTPGQSLGHEQYDAAHELEARFAALQMQQAMNTMENQHGQGREMYGSLQGHHPRRPSNQHFNTHQQQQLLQQQQAQMQAQQMDQLIRQKQAQLLQNQLLQHYQDQQAQLDALRQMGNAEAQAQQLASQQQMLMAQLQGNEEHLNWQQRQFEQPAHHRSVSASEQRNIAQANLQAALRQRQDGTAQYPGDYQGELSQQHQLLLQRIQGLRQSSQPFSAAVDNNAMLQRATNNRSGSPGTMGQARRERQPSSTAADTAKSWRSSSASAGRAGAGLRGTPPPPSIVVDDSASEKSDELTSADLTTPETPETSEEDVGAMLMRSKEQKGRGVIAPNGVPTIAPLGVHKRVPSTGLPAYGNATGPRMPSLGATPRPRNFASGDNGSRIASTGSSSAGSVTPSVGGSLAPQPLRQPRGPPTEFHALNFAARLSVRTRREAMVKLSASPRVASFANSQVAATHQRSPSMTLAAP